MSEMTVLVLDGHSRAALETLQSLGRAGVQVDLAAEAQDCLAMHSRYVSRKLQQPSQGQAAFETWLREQDKLRNYTLIVPATEASLLGLRQLDENDPLRHKVVIPGDESLDVALDKEKTLQLAHQLDVPTPAGILLSTLAEIGHAQSFPVVLKPTHSKVMVDGELRTLAVAVVKNESERQEQLRRWLPLTPVQQQQYVSGGGIGIEFLFNCGKKIWHFAHERVHEYPLTGGASSYRRSIDPPLAMLHDAEKLLTALNWHGVAMVEFKMNTNGQYWLMEINPRLWGSLALSIDSGVDFPLGLLQIAQGKEPVPQPKYKVPYYTRDLRTDVDWLKCNLRADRQDPLLHTRSRLFSFLELLRPLSGRESWDHFDWRDLAITRRALALAVTDQVRPVYRKLKDRQIKRSLLQRHRRLLHRLNVAGGPRRVVFLCYGNICRSPLAAAFAEQRLSGVSIDSAGFHQQTGRSSPQKILRIASSYGIDLSSHRSARAKRDQLANADLVIAMDLENLNRACREFPEMADRATLLGLFGTPETLAIADPYLADEAATNRICEQVRAGVEGLASWVSKAKPAACSPAIPSTAVGSR
ncbi:MAG TPA: ATP-grasp domain-containing protein [Candidatus Angelobacter sp.]|jgi:protein-tyrosine-phosphatase/predicted ATP-grasp superfamily ATP-dependent carboligase